FLGWTDGVISDKVKAMFDDFCDKSTLDAHNKARSCRSLTACMRIKPREAVLLDDIGL
ncbi:hypothetical protein F5880DRAFT_1437884, partial [Lentinula raphanica]